MDKEHIDAHGIKVSTVSINPARVNVKTNAITESECDCLVQIFEQESKGEPGKMVAEGKGKDVTLNMDNAKLWSADAPNLYQCRVSLVKNGELIDDQTEVFGIRMISWGPKGLYVNGEQILLKGGCLHHDNGILGARSFAEAEIRKIKIMKEMGFNAIRSAHNPCSRSMLEACDYLGMYIMDETWDMWYQHKPCSFSLPVLHFPCIQPDFIFLPGDPCHHAGYTKRREISGFDPPEDSVRIYFSHDSRFIHRQIIRILALAHFTLSARRLHLRFCEGILIAGVSSRDAFRLILRFVVTVLRSVPAVKALICNPSPVCDDDNLQQVFIRIMVENRIDHIAGYIQNSGHFRHAHGPVLQNGVPPAVLLIAISGLSLIPFLKGSSLYAVAVRTYSRFPLRSLQSILAFAADVAPLHSGCPD